MHVRVYMMMAIEMTSSVQAIPGMPWDIRLTSSTLSALPASAQPLVNALTVQQALVTTSPSAVQAGRQARAMHQDHEDPSLQPQQGSDARVVGEGLDMTVQFPVIEMLCQGEVIMRVSKSLYTGRVLLHTGTSGDTNLQSMASWSAVSGGHTHTQTHIHTLRDMGPCKQNILKALSWLAYGNFLCDGLMCVCVGVCAERRRPQHPHVPHLPAGHHQPDARWPRSQQQPQQPPGRSQQGAGRAGKTARQAIPRSPTQPRYINDYDNRTPPQSALGWSEYTDNQRVCF